MSAPFHMPDQADLDLARALHARRELGNALEFGFALLDALGLSPLALDVIDDAIAALDALDAADTDLEEDIPPEENGDAEPSLGAIERHQQSVARIDGRRVVIGADQAHWAAGGDDDREDDSSDVEPYLSACEWTGRGDNWQRSGAFTSGWGTDVEETSGAETDLQDPAWWVVRPLPAIEEAADV